MPDHLQTPPSAPPEYLRRHFELAQTELQVGGRRYQLLRPKSVDDLISEEDFQINERIPYWADCWPSARVLADFIATLPGARRRLLELGCGIGLVSLAAAAAGFDVLASDYYSDALQFTSANAQRHGMTNVDTRLVDWRVLPNDLGAFDVIVASDVIYEAPQPALVAAVLDRTLLPAGVGLVSDPGRRFVSSFIYECRQRKLDCSCIQQVRTTDAGAQLTVSIHEVRRASESG
jgi:ETFB lysine methyltransferase